MIDKDTDVAAYTHMHIHLMHVHTHKDLPLLSKHEKKMLNFIRETQTKTILHMLLQLGLAYDARHLGDRRVQIQGQPCNLVRPCLVRP